MNDYTPNGIRFDEQIISSQGAGFILFPESTHTKEDIDKAKHYIRDNRDVVTLRIANEDDLDYDYKDKIFRVPATKPLKWYQINQDENLIHKERLKGTSPELFVELYVLPCVERIEAMNFARFGEAMYNR